MPMNTRICSNCKSEKPISEFHRKNNGTHSQCKICRGAYTASYRELHPEKSRLAVVKWVAENPARSVESHKKSNLKRNYGLTLDEYGEMMARQKGCCAICSRSMETPNVDHCHETGRVRGLLCSTCNGGLGMFKDCVPLLEQAIRYLKIS